MAPPREQPTITSRLQRRVEEDVAEVYERLLFLGPQAHRSQQQQQKPPLPRLPLARRAHARFLRAALGPLPPGLASLDASRCWIVYWAVHGLALLGQDLAPGAPGESGGGSDEDDDESDDGGDDAAAKSDADADDEDSPAAEAAAAGPSTSAASPHRAGGRQLQRHHNPHHPHPQQPRTSSPVKAAAFFTGPPLRYKPKKRVVSAGGGWASGTPLQRGCGRRPRSPIFGARPRRGEGPPRSPRPPVAPGDDGDWYDPSSYDSTPPPSDDGCFAADAATSEGEGGEGDGEEDGDQGSGAAPSAAAVARFLRACQSPTGGFGGGPGQRPHLAPTYAAVAALVSLGSPRAWRALDRPALRAFLLRCADEARRRRRALPSPGDADKNNNTATATTAATTATCQDDDGCCGGFAMHEGGGEVDARSCYTALAAAELAGLDVLELAAASRAVAFLARCQTYEGGCGGEPGNEAHGGYSYCAAAACAIVRRAAERAGDEGTARAAAAAVDARSALRWAALRQGSIEGGFSGRTNKLADGCYSFWVGAMFPLLQEQVAWLRARGLWDAAGNEGGEEEEKDNGGSGSGSGNNHHLSAELDALIASVPQLPRALLEGKTRPPLEVARAAAALAKQRAADAAAAARRAGAASTGGGGGGGEDDDDEEEDPRVTALIDRAARARAAETRALADLKLAERSAALLVAGEEDGGGGDGGGGGGGGGDGDDDEAAAAAAAAPFLPSLCNPRALAMWVLLACQPAAAASAALRRARGASPEPPPPSTRKGGKKGEGSNDDDKGRQVGARPAGGLRDKPGKPSDFYHTCYCLSGLAAVTQQLAGGGQMNAEQDEDDKGAVEQAGRGREDDGSARLCRADPALNVLAWRAAAARAFWLGGGAAQAPAQHQQQPAVKMEE